MFDHPEFDGHESVIYVADEASGLRAIIAIHSTALGPAGGGVRMYPYPDEAAALTDALRLSAGMTYKAALADLPFGGGKAVVMGDPATKTEQLFEALGDAIEAVGGRYFCGEDVGTTPDDMAVIGRRTAHVVGLPARTGDPSPATADGVFEAMSAAVGHVLGRESLDGVRVAVQGAGHVGMALIRRLAAAGARLTVADVDAGAVELVQTETAARVVDPAQIHRIPADVFAPCALGGVINAHTIRELGARIVCGSANNQLVDPGYGRLLHERGVVYVPDYVAGAGGAISAMRERVSYGPGEFEQRISGIGRRVRELLERSARTGEAPSEAADGLARSIVAKVRVESGPAAQSKRTPNPRIASSRMT